MSIGYSSSDGSGCSEFHSNALAALACSSVNQWLNASEYAESGVYA